MGQESQSLETFFREFSQQNDDNNPYWGPAYRQLVDRVQREKPDFTEQTIQDLWYTRSNGVASLRQGGMSQEEYQNAKEALVEITKLIATGCTTDIYNQVHQRLHQLKSQGILRKFYRALCARAFAAFYPRELTSLINGSVFFRVYNYCKNHFNLPLIDQGNWLELNIELKTILNQRLNDDPDPIELNMSLWHMYEIKIEEESNAVAAADIVADSDDDEQETEPNVIMPPKNLILYGPPGTGKTYKTIEIAVRACEPKQYSLLDGKDKAERRTELKKIYDHLVEEKRVRFVTFHQSFGYEEFVEGLRAETNETGNVSYEIKAGVFKQICDDAAFGNAGAQLALDDALEEFKIQCAEQDGVVLKTASGKPFRVTYEKNTTFSIFPLQSKNEKLEAGYAASIKNIRKLYQGESKGIYNISYVRGILQHLITTWNIFADETLPEKKKQNYVLIIDEINRGNISKIFGELITLIETSKRAGETEALSVSLSYSADTFSVPNNLYLIGTMNTADRSLTALDTALRRRFEFEHLMPDESILEDASVLGIELKQLLETLNARIQVLYDSEHTLGHAFFISVSQMAKEDEQQAFKLLKRVMKNKIIPLLEEYFYNDWQKIRLVLGDNQKSNQAFQFVRSVENQGDLATLFGHAAIEDLQDAGLHYQLCGNTDKIWDIPLAYRQIYDPQASEQEQA
ncbi:ATP-binding protein [Gibbsiella quercinecans]|uniref:McrB family protein n=1 Tax=Gibbsiella quercinecans TaxID=929813 RepID=UPI000EF235A0|nr:AAA family ATPase [Gibbsiella quercinecans]RLM14725.1 ATP-binding protein [Gibbsiella quercinecans]